MARNVTLTMTIGANEPLLVETGRVPGNPRQVNRFVGRRLLCHEFTALFANFICHVFPPVQVRRDWLSAARLLLSDLETFVMVNTACCRQLGGACQDNLRT